MKKILITSILSVALVTGCASSKISSLPIAGAAGQQKTVVKHVAMAPSGALLADAVAIELMNRGFTVIDGASTSSMMVRLNISEVEITKPTGLAKLKEQGIDAYLSIKGAAVNGEVESASVRVNSTENGQVLAGLTWQNGWGGRRGSIADRTMKKGLSEIAVEIADELSNRITAN